MHWVWIVGAVLGAVVLAWRLWSSIRKAECKPASSIRMTGDALQALEGALYHPEDSVEEHVRIFHPGCGGLIVGSGNFQCDKCGGKFTPEELRELFN